MTTITIEQRQSGTGSIHSWASDQYDRRIRMDKFTWAVITPAYYDVPATRHRTAAAAIRAAGALSDYGAAVIDVAGDMFEEVDGDLLYVGCSVHDRS